MPRGGARPNSGPKKGSKPRRPIVIAHKSDGETRDPLQYMLDVMSNPEIDARTRLDAAKAAAPYVHPRKEAKHGKKQAAADDAKTAGKGTAWGGDLTPRVKAPH